MERPSDPLDHLFPAEDTASPAPLPGRRSRKSMAKPQAESPGQVRREEDEDEKDDSKKGKGKEVLQDGAKPRRSAPGKREFSTDEDESESEQPPRSRRSPAHPHPRSSSATTYVESHSFGAYKNDAEEATQQILGDLRECISTLRVHGANADELRHIVESWMSQVRLPTTRLI
jgi:hypothetical protein